MIATRYAIRRSAEPKVIATTRVMSAAPATMLHATISLRRSTRSAIRPAGNAAIAAAARFAAVAPAMIKGLRVSATVNSGMATVTRPSPLPEMPVAHQSRQNGAPNPRRAGSTTGSLAGLPARFDGACSTEATCTLPPILNWPSPGPKPAWDRSNEGYQGRAPAEVDPPGRRLYLTQSRGLESGCVGQAQTEMDGARRMSPYRRPSST